MVLASASLDVEPRNADIVVLLIGAGDAMHALVRRALEQARSSVGIVTCPNEEQGLAFLEARAKGVGGRLPDLILLAVDPDNPVNASFFAGLQTQALLGLLPVCVLAPTLDEATKRALYAEGVNAIVEKMDTLEGASGVLNTVVEFWFKMAQRAYIE